MPKQNITQLADELNKLVESVGLNKLAAEGVIADPGTTQPAEQTQAESQIAPATEGSRSAENSADVKSEVPGISVDESKPSDAEKTPASDKSAVDNITTASTPGEDPKVENAYGSANTSNYPGTTHPADVNKNPEKYSADQMRNDASLIINEISQNEKVAGMLGNVTNETAFNALGELLAAVEPGEKTAADKEAASGEAVKELLGSYIKTAALIGELTADYLDGVTIGEKTAEDGEEMPEEGGEDGGEEAPAEGGEEMPTEGGSEEDAAAEEILAEAEAIAAEIGVAPEEVLEAALEEEMGGGEEEMGVEPSEEDLAMLEAAIAEEAGGMPEAGAADMAGDVIPAEDMEVIASVLDAYPALQEKAAAYDELMAQLEKDAEERKNRELVSESVSSALENWVQSKKAAAQK